MLSSIIAIIISILYIILFFKIWGMTNDVRTLKEFIISRFNETDVDSPTLENDDDGIPSSRKYTRASDGKKILLKYMIGDEYECVDPVTNESLGRFKNYEIKKGW